MQPSPYTPGQIARQVPGRDEQLADIDEQISLMADLGEFIGRVRVDAAPRGMGKTSILSQVDQLAQGRGAVTVWAAGGAGDSLIGAVADRIDRQLRAWDGERPPSRTKHSKLRRVLDRLTLKLTVGVPGLAQVEASLDPPAKSGAASKGTRRPTDPTLEFEELITETVAAAQAEGHSGLVLLIDEIQSADAASLSTLAHTWQNLQRRAGPPLRAAVFAAGTPDAEDALRKAATFSERFHYPVLGPLTDQAVRTALTAPARERGVSWDVDALDAAVTFAEGFPFTVQLVGDEAWRAAGRPDPGSTLTLAQVSAGIERAGEALIRLHRTRWADATPAERKLLRAMARLAADTGSASVARSDIATALQTSSTSLSELRERLITKGVIRPTSRGRLGFTINGFGDYVLQDAED